MKTITRLLGLGIFLIFFQNQLIAQRVSSLKNRAIGNSYMLESGTNGPAMQNHITDISVDNDGTVHTKSIWDEGGHPCSAYKNGVGLGWEDCSKTSANSKTCTDLSGKTWTIQNYYGRFLNITTNHGNQYGTDKWTIDPVPTGGSAPYVKCSDGREIHDLVDPSAIGINKKTGELLIAENGPDQNIKVYNISGTPSKASEFGTLKGVYTTANGHVPGKKDSPLLFFGITGVGTDSNGNIYVSMDGYPGSEGESAGADLRAFNPDGTLRWRYHSNVFVQTGCVDPASNGCTVYAPFTKFNIDYSQPAGSDWTDEAVTIDPFKYPDDPRLVHATNVTLAVKTINGIKYMWCTDMYNNVVLMYRFDGEIAVPCAVYCAAFGWNGDEYIRFYWNYLHGRPVITSNGQRWIWVDQNGDGNAQTNEYSWIDTQDQFVGGIEVDNSGNIYMPTQSHLWKFPTNGFDAYGNPKYTAASMTDIGDIPGNVVSLDFVDAADIAVFGTGASNDNVTTCLVYDHWSTTKNLRYTFSIPGSGNSNSCGGPTAVAATQSYIYVTYGCASGHYTGKEGEVDVYRMSDGGYVGYISPGSETGNYSGWIDIHAPTYAYERTNGSQIVTVEEDGVGKIMVYEWCPSGNCGTAVCTGSTCNVAVTGVSVSPTSGSVAVGATLSLSPTVSPSNACNKNVSWSSSNTAVATVNSSGVVTGVATGTATITVTTSDGGKTATSSVTVTSGGGGSTTTQYEAENGTWGGTNTNKYNNPSASGGYLIGNITTQNSYVQISNVNGGSGGTATLVIGGFYNSAANSANLYVNSTLVQKVNFSTNSNYGPYAMAGISITLNAGTSNTIKLINDSGTTSAFNDIDYIKVTTSASSVAVTGVSVSPTSASVSIGSTTTITATVAPSNATNQNVTWSSSNTSVATVNSSGVVTGVAAGTATITVTTQDGSKTATSAITVTTVAVTSVSVSPTSATVNVGSTKALTTTIVPSNATNKTVTWSSSSTNVATVNSSGVVTGVAAGTATITVTTQDGSKTATCAITVSASTPVTTKYEAENGTWGGTNTNKYNNPSASGAYLIGNITTQNSFVQMTGVNGGNGGSATLVIGAFYGSTANSANLYVNGSLVQKVNFTTNSNYTPYEYSAITINLNSGTGNTIKLINESGTTSSFNDIDYFKVTTGGAGARLAGSVLPEETSAILIYPNPSDKGVIKVEFPEQTEATITLHDATGKSVYSTHVNTKLHEIPTGGIKGGMYLIRVQTKKDWLTRKVLIK